ncbi:MAG TPA: hypothetical protein VN746_10685, partial [Gaiella sp.]|nr:hypothetical protein [Gaiella sp.]
MTVAELVGRLVGDGTLTGATLSRPRVPGPDGPRRLTVEPVELRAGARWRVRRHYATRTTDENLDEAALTRMLSTAIGQDYRQALLHEPEA